MNFLLGSLRQNYKTSPQRKTSSLGFVITFALEGLSQNLNVVFDTFMGFHNSSQWVAQWQSSHGRQLPVVTKVCVDSGMCGQEGSRVGRTAHLTVGYLQIDFVLHGMSSSLWATVPRVLTFLQVTKPTATWWPSVLLLLKATVPLWVVSANGY